MVTATTSIGTSRQKQLLRFSGALVGGILLGIGSQIFVLPWIDGISGFTVLFVSVTAVACWILTSSPRLSYFGQQIALAFFIIQLRVPYPDTALLHARDNMAGIILGLLAMWFVFDALGSKPALVVMQQTFAEALRSMAKLAEPWNDSHPLSLGEIRTLREKISTDFTAVNAQADAALFEIGRDRKQNLQLREQLLARLPRLRSILLFEIELLQYRAPARLNELPSLILMAQRGFDTEVHRELEKLAERTSVSRTAQPADGLHMAYRRLCEAIQEAHGHAPPDRALAVLALSSHLATTLDSLLEADRADPVVGEVEVRRRLW